MPKLHPLSKVELYSLGVVLLLGAATGVIWQAVYEVGEARRELRTTRLDLAAARASLAEVQRTSQRFADATARAAEDAGA